MFEVADLRNIDQLNHYGRQLAVLKRIYQSYDLIIRRLLELQRPSELGTPTTNPTFDDDASAIVQSRGRAVESDVSDVVVDLDESSYGVPLAKAAIVRFQRLKDRINLYALSEIQECLDEKETLVMLVSVSPCITNPDAHRSSEF